MASKNYTPSKNNLDLCKTNYSTILSAVNTDFTKKLH